MGRTGPKIIALVIFIAAAILSVFIFGQTHADTAVASPAIEDIMKCLPPSALGCSDQDSYNRLQARLSERGAGNTEMAKVELAYCQQQISDYQAQLAIYNACASKLGLTWSPDPKILSTLGPYYCSDFLGDHSTFSQTSRMCECQEGYFIYQGECKTPTQICQAENGSGFVAQNFNCTNAPLPTKPTSPTNTSPIPLATTYLAPSGNNPKSTPVKITSLYAPVKTDTFSPTAPEGGDSAIMKLIKTIANFFGSLFK